MARATCSLFRQSRSHIFQWEHLFSDVLPDSIPDWDRGFHSAGPWQYICWNLDSGLFFLSLSRPYSCTFLDTWWNTYMYEYLTLILLSVLFHQVLNKERNDIWRLNKTYFCPGLESSGDKLIQRSALYPTMSRPRHKICNNFWASTWLLSVILLCNKPVVSFKAATRLV